LELELGGHEETGALRGEGRRWAGRLHVAAHCSHACPPPKKARMASFSALRPRTQCPRSHATRRHKQSLLGAIIACPAALSRWALAARSGAIVAWGNRCLGQSLLGAIVAWGDRCLGRSLLGAIVAWGDRCLGRSLLGAIVAWSNRCLGRSLLGTCMQKFCVLRWSRGTLSAQVWRGWGCVAGSRAPTLERGKRGCCRHPPGGRCSRRAIPSSPTSLR
jgi:hypothetical protein